MSPYCQPSTIRHSNNAGSSGARSRSAIFTRRDYIVVATDRTNDLKIRWVHSPHLCRTLAHRVVRVGRLLQTRPKVSGVVCHRNYCPGLLTHGSGHPSIGNYRYIQPQDSAAPDTETRFPCLQTRSGAQNTGDRAQARRKAPEVPERAVVLGGDRFRGGMGLLGIIFWEGIGIMAALALRAMAQREVDLEQLFAAQEVGAGCEEPRGGHWSRRVRSSCATGRIR